MIIELNVPVSGMENLQTCMRKIETIYPSSPSVEEIAGLLIAHVSDEDFETQIHHELEGLKTIPEVTEQLAVYVQDDAGIRIVQHFEAMADTLTAVTDEAVTACACMACAMSLISPSTFFELYDSVMLSALQE